LKLAVVRTVGLGSKEYIGMHSFLLLLILYEEVWCENIYSSFGRIQHVFVEAKIFLMNILMITNLVE